MSVNKEAILEKIHQTDRLPVLPATAVNIIALSNDGELYPAKVAPVISQDPLLAARLLSVANSAMFSLGREITNLTEALSILGVDLTMSIAVGFVLVDSMREDESVETGFNYDLFWRKSVLGAVAAVELKAELSGVNQGDLFVAALMQDIGVVALDSIVGRQYVAMVNGARSHLDLVEMERRAFGLDHAEIGGAVLQRWGLPALHCNAVERSHHLLDKKPLADIDDLQFGVAFSGMLAEQWMAEMETDEALDDCIQSSVARISDEGLQRAMDKTIEAVPVASEVFKLQLLDPDQLSRVA